MKTEFTMPKELSIHRRSKIRIFCQGLAGYPNLTQAGRYALRVLSIAGDGQPERRAILAHIWEYHTRLVSWEIPFLSIILSVAVLCMCTGCTPY